MNFCHCWGPHEGWDMLKAMQNEGGRRGFSAVVFGRLL